MLGQLEDGLRNMDVKYVLISGEVTQVRRDKLLANFQEDDVTSIALLGMTAAGVGLNMTRANVVLFAELNWSVGTLLQCEDRVHRYIISMSDFIPHYILYTICTLFTLYIHIIIYYTPNPHRLGQKSKDVQIIYVIARGTTDEVMWEQVQYCDGCRLAA